MDNDTRFDFGYHAREINGFKVSLQIDPHGFYAPKGIQADEIFISLGYLPGWVLNKEYFHLPLKEAMDTQYPFGLYETPGATLDEQECFVYPGDPSLHPLIRIERGDEVFLQYEHALVAFKGPSSTFITRMD